MALRLGEGPVVLNGPIGPSNLITIGAFFLLREIESSLILFKSVVVNKTSKQVWVHLAASNGLPGPFRVALLGVPLPSWILVVRLGHAL